MTLTLFNHKPQLHEALKKKYAEPHRRYHTWTHIEQLVDQLENIKDLVKNQHAVSYSIFYHDAIYNIPGSSNEKESADLFVRDATDHLGETIINLVAQFINATKAHVIPKNLTNEEHSDCQHFLDMDMSILGSDLQTYLQYAKDIRQEYIAFNDEMYNFGRAKVLEEFLQRDKIFLSDHFNKKLEEAARSNIARELSTLHAREKTS